jgi:hypothetical protein
LISGIKFWQGSEHVKFQVVDGLVKDNVSVLVTAMQPYDTGILSQTEDFVIKQFKKRYPELGIYFYIEER